MAFTAKTPGVIPIQNTSAVFIATNPVLLYGQVAIETDTNRTKSGDGTSTYTQLTYAEWSYEIVESTGVDTYVGTFASPHFLAYFPMMRVRVRFASANTGASTLNIGGKGAKAINKNVSVALVSGDILAGGIYDLVYDGTNFQILNPSTSVVIYKKYIATAKQNGGTGELDVTVLENTIGAIVWTRLSAGVFYGTLAGIFPDSTKTHTLSDMRGQADLFSVLGWDTANRVILGIIKSTNGAATDPGTTPTISIEIKVYP